MLLNAMLGRATSQGSATILKSTEERVVMPLPEDPLGVLARRLRGLRTGHWPGRSIIQHHLAEALGASAPLISSWENPSNPAVPPLRRLEAYATFFATERSVAKQPFRLLDPSHLTPQERTRRDELLRELAELRAAAVGPVDSPTAQPGPIGGFWRFPPNQDLTIICGEFPEERRAAMPYADPDSPDYEERYKLTDIGALIELHGHIRAANPMSRVNIRAASETMPDDYTTHLIVLGGVDWNTVTRDLMARLDIPVRQLPRPEDADIGAFEVSTDKDRLVFQPILRTIGSRELLVEDVAHVYRGPNPFNRKRKITICNGMFARGTLGAARVFTDARFRDRNEAYVRKRFANEDLFSIITRVDIVNDEAVTPDWTNADALLHEWPEVNA